MKVEFVDCFLTTYDYYTIYIYLLFAAQDAVKRIIKKERKRARERARERERASERLIINYFILYHEIAVLPHSFVVERRRVVFNLYITTDGERESEREKKER